MEGRGQLIRFLDPVVPLARWFLMVSALAGLACEDKKAATSVVTSFNRKTRAGKGKEGPPGACPLLLGKLLEDQRRQRPLRLL